MRNLTALLVAVIALGPSGALADAKRDLFTADFFRAPRHQSPVLSPDGDLVAVLVDDEGDQVIRVFEPKALRTLDVYRIVSGWSGGVRRHLWVGTRTLLVEVAASWSTEAEGKAERVQNQMLYEIIRGEEGLNFVAQEIRLPGHIVLPLAGDDERVLWSPSAEPHAVYRAPLRSFAVGSWNLTRSHVEAAEVQQRAAEMKRPVVSWMCDRDGTPRLAVAASDEGKVQYWYRKPGADGWNRFYEADFYDPDRFELAGLDENGHVLVMSRVPTGRTALYRYDPEQSSLGEAVYEHESADLLDLRFDSDWTRIRSVVYVERGRGRFHFPSPTDREAWKYVTSQFRGQSTWMMDASRDSKAWVVWVGRSNDPGLFAYLDLESGRQIKLGDVLPWLPPEQLASVESGEIEVEGVGRVEFHLAMPPRTEERPPLIVFPHGGPIGIMDLAEFNPVVQHLANGGFAVLQVNYRGSGGYGRAFEEAGRRQWGRGIEDDIDSVLEQIVATGEVDGDRMCIVGASYGGYSALMSIIRHPRRFRCAATWAGPTDLGLLFNSSDFTVTEQGRAGLAELVGHPTRDYDELRANSPVYLVDRIETPILLAHGELDERVHVEHAHRLAAMLELHGKEFELAIIRQTGHSFGSPALMISYYAKLKNFLWDHLEDTQMDGEETTLGAAEP